MISMYNSLYSKNSTVQPTPMITKSKCRCPYCRIHSSCICLTKPGGLQHTVNHSDTKFPNELLSISIPHAITVRNSHNQLYLLTPNEPKITHRVFLCQSYSISYHGTQFCHHLNTNSFFRLRTFTINSQFFLLLFTNGHYLPSLTFLLKELSEPSR